MFKSKIVFGVVSLLFLLFTVSCTHKAEENKQVQSNDYVSAYTTGQISAHARIRVVLNLPEEYVNISNEAPPQDVFTLKPEVKGKTYWSDQYTLVFSPDEPLENGIKYEANVNIEKLLGLKDRKKNRFTFYFEVVPLLFHVEVTGLKSYNNNETKWNYLEGEVSSSDVLTDLEEKELLQAKQGERKLKITYKVLPGGMTLNFKIDSIERKDKKSSVEIKWSEGFDHEKYGKYMTINYDIPSVNKFEFVKATVQNDPDQLLTIEFTDPLDEDQDLDGLVYFEDYTPVQLSIEGNRILVNTTIRLVGEKVLRISKNVKSRQGSSLKDDVEESVFYGQLKPAVRFTSDGTIMPGKDGWILPFEAVNLRAVDVLIRKIYAQNVQQFLQINHLGGSYQLHRVSELIHHEKVTLAYEGENVKDWHAYAIDLSKMINKEPGAIYRVELRFRQAYSVYDCPGTTVNNEDLDDDELQDYYTYEYYSPPDSKWSDRDNPCKPGYYGYDHFIKKNVVASNIGLTVKEDGDKLMVMANNLLTTKPMASVKLVVVNYQQRELARSTTNSDGEATINLVDEAYLLVAEKDGQYAYLRLDGGSSLSYSKFDTKGVDVSKGIKAYIYGDRGVWRPGDTLFLTVIVDDRDNPLPQGHPVTLKLTDPRGMERIKKTMVNGTNGFYAFKIPTDPEFPTGFWKAIAGVGGSYFTKSVRIETIKPNRLKIELELDKTILEEKGNKATLKARWLHGGIASGLKADVNISVKTQKTVFNGFEGFNFDDPSRKYWTEEETIFDDTLNKQGMATFKFDLPPSRFSPGMLKVSFVTKVYERGGDFSIDQTTANYAPFDNFIGIKGPDVNRYGYVEVDKKQMFEVATVSKDGKALSLNGLEYEVYKLAWSWWYGSNSGNIASYISNHYEQMVQSGTFSTRNGKGTFFVDLKYPSWGLYYVLVKQKDGGHRTGLKVHFDWPSSYARKNRKAPGSANLLSLIPDKDNYEVGETVKVSVPTPDNARLLIALEKGNGELRRWQMEAETGTTVISFEATKEMTPNVYLFVSVLQPHDQTVNDLPIRMYGVTPVMVRDKSTILEPILEVPESVRPEQDYTIKVSEKNNRKMTYTLAVVDDGLLDLTHFKTPSPYDYFYAKEALAVKTWDLYDDVMGAYGKRLEKVFAVGGDMEITDDTDGKKANRFKPVITFLGPYELNAGETNKHKLHMPNYVGSVRCMVIAGQDGAYGHTQKSFPVKQPLMVLGTLPRVLAPGESVKLPVSVFVMDGNIKSVNIELETNRLFKVKNSIQTLQVSGEGEHMAYFDLESQDIQGVGKVKVIAKSGREKASYEIELQVRNPNKRSYEVTYHLLKPGDEWVFEPELIGTEGSNKMNLTVSDIPSLNLDKRLDYLIHYPYGCIEQTTSSVFPQLYLYKLVEIDKEKKLEIDRNVKEGIKKIREFQLPDGSFSYWPGSSYGNDWGTSYAGNFLILAKEEGYYVPQSMIDSWIRYQTREANGWMYKKHLALNQTYRLYTLALAGKPDMGAMNRLRANDDLPSSAKFRLAAAYALAGQKVITEKLIRNVNYNGNENGHSYYNYGSVLRDMAMNMETYLLIDNREKAADVYKYISDQLKSDQWMSTQTTAFTLYAVSLFAGDNETGKGYRFKYVWNHDQSDQISSKTPVVSVNMKVNSDNKLKLENLSDKNLFATFTSSGIPKGGKEIRFEKYIKMDIRYYDMDGNPLDITNLKHGTDFYSVVTVTNPGIRGNLENMALTQIFPSGWEIINTRMFDLGGSLKSDKSDYTDYRDDRVDIFFSLPAGEQKRFIVLLNAAYRGKYYMPVTRCSAMYQNDVNAASGGGWIHIVK